MTLRQVTRALNLCAMAQKNVKMIVEHDIFRINDTPAQRYGVFSWLEGQHRLATDTTEWHFTLFFVDRLTNDRSNEGQIRSEGVETLRNIIRRMEERYGADASTPVIRTFTERFLDECGGAYAEVAFTTPNAGVCEDYVVGGDFNEDYNNDFLVY